MKNTIHSMNSRQLQATDDGDKSWRRATRQYYSISEREYGSNYIEYDTLPKPIRQFYLAVRYSTLHLWPYNI